MLSDVLSIISVAVIYSVALSSSPAQAARIKLGNCYKQKCVFVRPPFTCPLLTRLHY